MGETITLVIAHPDDECMFFYPTISRAKRLHIICLSNGGYDGLGEEREEELQRAARRLGASATCVNNAALQDGPHAWDPSVVAANVGPWLHAGAVVVTFDRYGASGHGNHVAVYHGAAPASFARRGDGVTLDARRRETTSPDETRLPVLRARDGASLPAVHRRAGRGVRRRARAFRSAPVRARCPRSPASMASRVPREYVIPWRRGRHATHVAVISFASMACRVRRECVILWRQGKHNHA